MAFAIQGDGDKAVTLLQMMHPIQHTSNENEVQHYMGEPYVLAGDVYALTGQVGRAGWTWYSGSAGWMYRIWLEEILGFTLRGQTLTINPHPSNGLERFQTTISLSKNDVPHCRRKPTSPKSWQDSTGARWVCISRWENSPRQ